jgi:hypothetical protein
MATWTDPSATASGPGDVTPQPRRARPDPYERYRDREWDRDELQDRLTDGEADGERWRASSSASEDGGYW